MTTIITDAKGRQFELTGEYRKPLNGEWYMLDTNKGWQAHKATFDQNIRFFILRYGAQPKRYIVEVELDEDQFEHLTDGTCDGKECPTRINIGRTVSERLAARQYREVTQ